MHHYTVLFNLAGQKIEQLQASSPRAAELFVAAKYPQAIGVRTLPTVVPSDGIRFAKIR
jgi:hypothetical protein